MRNRTLSGVFPPGEFIRDELEARGWTQKDIANIIGRPSSSVNLIINDKRGVTPETAILLGCAFGTSPEFWLKIDSIYRLSKASKLIRMEEVRQRAAMLEPPSVNETE